MIRLKPNQDRAKKAITVMWIMIGASAMMIVSNLLGVKIIRDIESGVFDPETLMISSIIVGISAFIFLIVFIINVVFFIMWFRRAYYNLHQVSSGKPRYKEGWAAGAWFIPIFNLFGPYQIAKELHSNTENLLIRNNLIQANNNRHIVVGWWWALWIVSSVIGQIGNRIKDTDPNALYISTISIIISLGSAYLGIRMIKNYNEMEILIPQIETGNQILSTAENNSDLLDTGI